MATTVGSNLGYEGEQTLTRQQILAARNGDTVDKVVELHVPRPIVSDR